MPPDYKQIYRDIIKQKYPDKYNDLNIRDRLNNLRTSLDVIKFNELLFGATQRDRMIASQKLRSYDKETIVLSGRVLMLIS